jgi:hypothetical protein
MFGTFQNHEIFRIESLVLVETSVSYITTLKPAVRIIPYVFASWVYSLCQETHVNLQYIVVVNVDVTLTVLTGVGENTDR